MMERNEQTMAALADVSSELRGLGRPLSLAQAPVSVLPAASAVQRLDVDAASTARWTRVGKSARDPLAADRIVSELYPAPPPLERLEVPRPAQARWVGRDPVVISR